MALGAGFSPVAPMSPLLLAFLPFSALLSTQTSHPCANHYLGPRPGSWLPLTSRQQSKGGKRRSGCFLPGSSLILFSISVGSPPCSAMTAPWVMLPSGLFSRTWDRSGLREHSFL